MGVPWSVEFGSKLETRNSGQARKRTAYKYLRIHRFDHTEDLKEKGIKKYGKEQKGGKWQEEKKWRSEKKGGSVQEWKKKRLKGNKKKDLGQKVCQALYKEKQILTKKVACKTIMQQSDRVDLRAAIRFQRGWASVRASFCPISHSRESGEAQATSFSTQPHQVDILQHETLHVVGIYSLSLSPHNEQGPQLVICLLEAEPGSWQPVKQAAKIGRSGKGV